MTNNNEAGLDELFKRYGASCPDLDASANFMPSLWQKIEARHGFWPMFQSLARAAMAGCAALALLLLALNFAGTQPLAHPSYTDALVADHNVEKTYYAESVSRQMVQQPDTEDSRY